MRAIAVIPARGGSKALPGKNIALFGGKPLIEWTVRAAQQAKRFSNIVVSTDSPEIAQVALSIGAEVPWLRPAELAQDDSPTLAAVVHALKHYPEAETVALLQPTSPLRLACDIEGALDLFSARRRPVISVAEAKPWLFSITEDGGLAAVTERIAQRQSYEVVAPNGAIYIAAAASLLSGGSWWDDAIAYPMPAERSSDIDTLADLVAAEALLGLSSRADEPTHGGTSLPTPANRRSRFPRANP